MLTQRRRKPVLDTGAVMRPGTQFICELADDEACDKYRLRIDQIGDGMRFSHAFANGRDPPRDDDAEFEGPVEVGAAALERGDGVLYLSQGRIHGRETTCGVHHSDTPPFLVGRSQLAALKAGEEVSLTIFGKTFEVKLTRRESIPINVDCVPRRLVGLVATGRERYLSVYIIDDETWPVLLHFEFGRDNYIALHAIFTSM